MTKKVPEGVPLVLEKVGEANTFQLQGEGKPLLPNGKFVLKPAVKLKEAAGKIKIKLIAKPEQISTNSGTYQEVATWTCEKDEGHLDALLFSSDTPATAQWKLVAQGETKFTDKKQQNNLNLDIPGIELRRGDVVTIYVKSDGATTIVADAAIQGREIGE